MNGKKLMGMGIALAVLVALALMQNKGAKKGHPAKAENGATLLQGLDLNAVDALAVSKGSNAVALVRKEGKWVVETLHGYPADFKKLAAALRTAAEVKLGPPLRAANVDAAEFGLDGAKTILLESGGKEASKVEVGARREASESAGWANQHFIRKDGKDAIHLVDYDFRPFAETAEEWIDKELLNVRSADIVAVRAGDVELKVDGAEWKLADLDEATEEFQPAEANKLRMALQYLNCVTVANPAKGDAELGFTNAVAYTAQTTNQTITVALGGETEDGRYVRFSGDVPERLNGWTYVVSSAEAADFLIPRSQLVKAKEPPAAAEPEGGNGGGAAE